MPELPHLNLIQVLEKRPFKPGNNRKKKGSQTLYNLQNRQTHFDNLSSSIEDLQQNWLDNLQQREEAGLLPLPEQNVIPVFLQIDLSAKDLESLKSFGIDIISEEDEGFILGANADGFDKFTERLEQFLNQSNKKFKDSAASILQIIVDPSERLRRILSHDLFERWGTIEAEPELVVYIALSAYLRTPDYPDWNDKKSEEQNLTAIERWKSRNPEWERKKDELAMQRQTTLENIIAPYNAEFLGRSQYADFDDGFGCKIRISGLGLKDVISNCPYIFNVEEHDRLESYRGISDVGELLEIDILPPDEGSPKVCVIDSGVDENHRLLAPAVDIITSVSYVTGDTSTFDKVSGGGHGTRVAGVILYPEGFGNIPQPYKTPFWIQNARILNNENELSTTENETDLMRQIVTDFSPTKIFNLSVCRQRPNTYTHMPVWAAAIDKLIWENDIVFIISTGNIPGLSVDPRISCINSYLSRGLGYPNYLKEEKSKITNPGYSCFALTVGSICHDEFDDGFVSSFGKKHHPSAFSRCGLGLWGMIKPDVVEYGGDFVAETSTRNNIATKDNTSPQLVRSTRDGGPAVGRDAVGTSFSTPKVTHIAAALQAIYPNEPALLYRALIVQSASIPEQAGEIEDYLCHYGYGLPNIDKATSNSSKRVTLYAKGNVNPKNADLYLVKIPEQISRPGNDYKIRVEVTLSYKAEPRITRKGTRSYLSSWLDWETSKVGESLEVFRNRILSLDKEDVVDNDNLPEAGNNDTSNEAFKWVIASRTNAGEFHGIRRQDSTLQKDWCTVDAYNVPKEFAIAVKGHKGWEKDLDKTVPYALVVSFEVLDVEVDIDIYNLIEVENRIEVELPAS